MRPTDLGLHRDPLGKGLSPPESGRSLCNPSSSSKLEKLIYVSSPALGYSPRDMHVRCSHTPAVGKCLNWRALKGARRPSATPLAFGPLIDPLVVLKLLDVARKHKFLPSEPYCLAPWWPIKNHNICLCSLTKVPLCQIHAKFMPEKL